MLIAVAKCRSSSFFFFNDTATTEIYTLSLHDALPILTAPVSKSSSVAAWVRNWSTGPLPTSISAPPRDWSRRTDRKSTRLNSSHGYISYAVFCLKKKTRHTEERRHLLNALCRRTNDSR